MKTPLLFSLFYLATFLQAGTYGLTFLLPKLFENLGGNEKHVGLMLVITAATTIVSVYYSGHITDRIGRMNSLGTSGIIISVSLLLFGVAEGLGLEIVIASALLGLGWGIFYTIGPVVLSSITRAEQRVQIFSLNSIFIMAGFGLSPVFASVLEANGFTISHAFHFMSAICIVSSCLFLFIKNNIESKASPNTAILPSRLTISAVTRIFASRARVPVTMVCLGASVFAGMSNFQTVFADARNLDYAKFFLSYTVTVIICRIILTGFSGGKSPYSVIAILQYTMALSIIVFVFSGSNAVLYIFVAILFGIGYGASYPILVAMAANDANTDLVPQTLQLFALTYFIGIFGFPLLAGWIIVELNSTILLFSIAVLALIEATMALKRSIENSRKVKSSSR